MDNLADAETLTAIEKEAEEAAGANAKSRSVTPVKHEGDDDGETGGEDEGEGTDLEHDLNETMDDYEVAEDGDM